MANPTQIRIGTRRSKLALWQAHWVQDKLLALNPGIKTEIIKLDTRGDQTLEVLTPEIGDKGFFTEELDRALMNGELDLAVHSLKDLPTELPVGLELGAVCNRRWSSDVLIAKGHQTLADLKYGAKIGTCSLRRMAQLKRYRSDFQILPLRGNVPTRIKKLEDGEYDAIVLAEAGVRRLGLEQHISEILHHEVILPAPAQGALAIEIKKSHHNIHKLVAKLNDPIARTETTCERALLNQLGAGCQVPVAAIAKVVKDELFCDALVASLNGEQVIHDSIRGLVFNAQKLGKELAQKLLQNGGNDILGEIRKENTHFSMPTK